MKIGVVGAGGRMGRMNIETILNNKLATLAGALEIKGSSLVGSDAGVLVNNIKTGVTITDDIENFLNSVDGIIDFSAPNSTIEIGKITAGKGLVHIIGTTGLSLAQEETLTFYAKNSRIVYAPNFSIGVNLAFSLVEKAAKALDDNYDIEIVEMHHNKKVDAPSGTALGLGKAAAKGRGVKLDSVWCKSRDGHVGARKKGEIGFATLRGGDVIGDHTVMFAADGERVEITHKASSRDVFSKGAVKACLWANSQKAGLYSMADVLGI
jgi:4-hydroxy-tetrahydrodipicolinate reductase